MNSPSSSSTVFCSVEVEASGQSAEPVASSSAGAGGVELGASPGRLAELEELMECVKCGDIPVPSYYLVCPKGHTQCGFCAFNLSSETMTDCCQPENLEAGSEPLLKFVLDNSKWRCKHWDRGCKEVLSYEQWAVHSSKCINRYFSTRAEEEAERKEEEAKRKAEEDAEVNAFWNRDIPVPSKFLEPVRLVRRDPQSPQPPRKCDIVHNNNSNNGNGQSPTATSVPKPKFWGRGHGRRMMLDVDRTEKPKETSVFRVSRNPKPPEEWACQQEREPEAQHRRVMLLDFDRTEKPKETSVFRVSRNPKPPEEVKCQQEMEKPEGQQCQRSTLGIFKVVSSLKCYSIGCNAFFETTEELWMHLRDNETGHALPLIDCSETMAGTLALELVEWGQVVRKMVILKCSKDVYIFASEQHGDNVIAWVWSLNNDDETGKVKGQEEDGESKDKQKSRKGTGYQLTLQAHDEDGNTLENDKMTLKRNFVPYNLSPEEVIRRLKGCNLSLWQLKHKYFAVVDGKPMRDHWNVKIDILPGPE